MIEAIVLFIIGGILVDWGHKTLKLWAMRMGMVLAVIAGWALSRS